MDNTEEIVFHCIVCYDDLTTVEGEYECGHVLCYRCACRLVLLKRINKCPQCNLETKFISFKSRQKNYELALNTDRSELLSCIADRNLFGNHSYENDAIKFTVYNLLKISCELCENYRVFNDINRLISHVWKEHGKSLCKVCIDQNFQFVDEYILYSKEKIKVHLIETHVFCIFCKKYFFDISAARNHCKKNYHVCSVCDILGMKHLYFETFESLEKHCLEAHYCCKDVLCQKNHCFVFPYQKDLMQHHMTIHKRQLTSKELSCGLDFYLYSRIKSKKDNLVEMMDLGLKIQHDDLAISEFANSGIVIETCLLQDNPRFPQFSGISTTRTSLVNDSQVPSYLKGKIKLDRKFIAKITGPQNLTRVFDLLVEYLNGKIELQCMIDQLSGIITGKKIFEILNSQLYSIEEIKDFLPEYINRVKFPTFSTGARTSTTRDNSSSDLDRLKKEFKFLDLSKRKR